VLSLQWWVSLLDQCGIEETESRRLLCRVVGCRGANSYLGLRSVVWINCAAIQFSNRTIFFWDSLRGLLFSARIAVTTKLECTNDGNGSQSAGFRWFHSALSPGTRLGARYVISTRISNSDLTYKGWPMGEDPTGWTQAQEEYLSTSKRLELLERELAWNGVKIPHYHIPIERGIDYRKPCFLLGSGTESYSQYDL